MLTKSKSATWFKMALAVVLLLPCLLLFTACGGDPIEQDEALSALTEAGTIANYENVKASYMGYLTIAHSKNLLKKLDL